MRARLPNPESDVVAIQWGVKDGFPMCCIAQFVNDHYNPETYASGMIRRGIAQTKVAGKKAANYVPCFECDPEMDTELRFMPDEVTRDGACHGGAVALAKVVVRPKPLIAPPPMEIR